MRYLAFTILFLLTFSGFSQQLGFKTFNVQQGLPQSQVFDIHQDERGYIWLATQGGGLSRFDGREFYTLTRKSGLASSFVSVILPDTASGHWAGCRNGISLIQEDKVSSTLPLPEGINTFSLAFYKGELYVGTDEGLFIRRGVSQGFDRDTLVRFSLNPKLSQARVNCFWHKGKELWAGTSEGLINVHSPFKTISEAKGLSKDMVTAVTEFDGGWLIGTYGGQLMFYKNRHLTTLETVPELDQAVINDLMTDKDGQVWISTRNEGLVRMSADMKDFQIWNEANGLPNDHIRCVREDKYGGIWIGSSGGGVSFYKGSSFRGYSERGGLSGDYVYDVLQTPSGELWVTSGGGGVDILSPQGNRHFGSQEGFTDEKCRAVFRDDEGRIWIGTDGEGIGLAMPLWRDDTIRIVGQDKVQGTRWVQDICQWNGRVWFATSGGGLLVASVFDTSKVSLEAYRSRAGMVPSVIQSLSKLRDGLYMASPNRLYRLSADRCEGIPVSSGSIQVRMLSKNGPGMFWAATDAGLYEYRLGDSTARPSRLNDVLESLNIYQVEYDGQNLWVGSEKGLQRLELDSTGEVVSMRTFGAKEGFSGVETVQKAISCPGVDRVLSGTIDGLFEYLGPSDRGENKVLPTLELREFFVNFEPIRSLHGLTFSAGALEHTQNNIGISFKALAPGWTDAPQYSWRLVGVDESWSPALNQEFINYPDLPPGRYTLLVRARVPGGEWTDAAEASFSIKQPYWETTWFKVALYGLIGLGLALIILAVVLRSRAKRKKLNERLLLEKRMIELEQKALRLQMNPHFIFNALQSIQTLISLRREKDAKLYLTRFAKLLRKTLENSRETFISIEDEVETLVNYLELENFSRQPPFTYDIEIDSELDDSMAILPPMMVQPFLENAIIHGLKHIEHTGHITVRFSEEDDHLRIEVEDNGAGRQKAAQMKAQKWAYHKSTALAVTQERLDELNSDATFKSMEVEDLHDEEGQPCGTRVILRVGYLSEV